MQKYRNLTLFLAHSKLYWKCLGFLHVLHSFYIPARESSPSRCGCNKMNFEQVIYSSLLAFHPHMEPHKELHRNLPLSPRVNQPALEATTSTYWNEYLFLPKRYLSSTASFKRVGGSYRKKKKKSPKLVKFFCAWMNNRKAKPWGLWGGTLSLQTYSDVLRR